MHGKCGSPKCHDPVLSITYGDSGVSAESEISGWKTLNHDIKGQLLWIRILWRCPRAMYKAVARLCMIVLKVIRILFKTKDDLVTENLALRQQLPAYKAKKIKPKLSDTDRSFWVALKQASSNWTDTLIIAKPETVVDWQRCRFKKYW